MQFTNDAIHTYIRSYRNRSWEAQEDPEMGWNNYMIRIPRTAVAVDPADPTRAEGELQDMIIKETMAYLHYTNRACGHCKSQGAIKPMLDTAYQFSQEGKLLGARIYAAVVCPNCEKCIPSPVKN